MLRTTLATVLVLHGSFQLFGAAVAFELVDAERFYEDLLVGGQLVLASAGGAPIGIGLAVTGVGFVIGAAVLLGGRRWALPLVGITILASMLVTALGERSVSMTLVNVLLVLGVWQLWRSEPAWRYPR